MKFQSRDFPVMQWLDTVAAKRDAGYWNDCEFSPMSCLLRRKRAIFRTLQAA
uniref:Acetyltransferase n=1 Tax=Angiostrongylus cantonensis TaxID=6313 RepID=A0A0K0D9J5_ANGCA